MLWIFYLAARLYLSFNYDAGMTLELSDGSKWTIRPEDTVVTSVWIVPVEVEIQKSQDKDYPYSLHNISTKQTVKAKKL